MMFEIKHDDYRIRLMQPSILETDHMISVEIFSYLDEIKLEGLICDLQHSKFRLEDFNFELTNRREIETGKIKSSSDSEDERRVVDGDPYKELFSDFGKATGTDKKE